MSDGVGELQTDGSQLLDVGAQAARNTSTGSKRMSAVTAEYELKKYNVGRNGRKLAIIINIKEFSQCDKGRIPDRRFSEVDESVITHMMEETLGFDIFTKHDCTEKDLKELFLELQGWDYKHVDAVVFVLMSYGDNRDIYTADGHQVKINDLLDYVKGENCPGLAGIPKIVFINAGMWEETAEEFDDTAGYDEVDASGFPAESESVREEKKICIPKECDFIYVYSPVTFGHQKTGQVEQGNIFLTALSEMCLKLQSEDLEFCDLLTRTNRQVAHRVSSASSIPSRPCFFLSTLTKELYLPAAK